MADGPTIFLISLVEIAAIVLPASLTMTSLRRSRHARGYNRWLYRYIAGHAVLMLTFVLGTGPVANMPHVLALVGAWLTLPLWLCVRDQTRGMPSYRANGHELLSTR